MKYFCLIALAAVAFAQNSLPPELQGIGIVQRLGEQVPLGATFVDEDARQVTFGSLLNGKPVVLALVYYECPMLCSQILSGVVHGLRPLNLRVGRDFEVIAISINPRETPAEATAKRTFYAASYAENGSPDGWHFLTGTEESIRAVADAVGFHYRYDPLRKMYIHASGVTILTPRGKTARYLYGVEFQPKDMKLALMEASSGKIGSRVDQILLFCYHYDPATGKYGLAAMNTLRIAAALLVIALAFFLIRAWRREIRYGHQVLGGRV